ncbi:tumor necrosis factor ligand superfamily member 10 isoform X1 [Pagrus major]|uniref:tumor necrosis factor ligand superfamily member 10 isoform X1 n=1 Tax=Pagrus major TaxID=143350 RepID=UPI003CC8A2FE
MSNPSTFSGFKIWPNFFSLYVLLDKSVKLFVCMCARCMNIFTRPLLYMDITIGFPKAHHFLFLHVLELLTSCLKTPTDFSPMSSIFISHSLFFFLSLHALCKSLCQNVSNPQTSWQKGGTILSQEQPKESNDIPSVRPYTEQDQKRPFAQLIGSKNPAGENNVVQWIHRGGEAVTYNMGYNNGRLLVNKDGYYYLYSKVTINAAENCLLIQHKVMKETQAYGKPIELMKSKSFRCPKSSSEMTTEVGEDLWNSFLSGIFQLQSGDQIFVTLEDIQKIRPGTTENLMGAFMISP